MSRTRTSISERRPQRCQAGIKKEDCPHTVEKKCLRTPNLKTEIKKYKESANKRGKAQKEAIKLKARLKKKLATKTGAPQTRLEVKKTNIARSKNRVLNADDFFKTPCPENFERILVQRQAGKSAGRFDTYYVSAAGEKFRSRPEIDRYVERNGITDVTSAQFEFLTHLSQLEGVNLTTASSNRRLKKTTSKISFKSKATTPVLTKEIKIYLKRVNHLIPTTESSREEELPEESPLANDDQPGLNIVEQLVQSPAPLDPRCEEHSPPADARLDFNGVEPHRLQTPGWIPSATPYHLIFEEPDIHRNLWKLLTASIIVFYNKMDSYVHR